MDMKTYTSRILPLALSAVLVFAACGGDDAGSDGPIDTVGEQPGLRAPTPIKITGGSGTRDSQGNSAPALATEDAAASSDMMIAPAYWISEYVVGDGMPALPTDDSGYVFDATREVTAEQVAQIAAALGVSGEPVRLVEEWGNSWRVGPDDGSAPTLWVSEDGTQSWNYNGAWQGREAVVGCAVSVDSDGNESSDCPEPEPPVGVPTQAEAEQRATEYLVALGVDVAALDVESYGDEWFASVTFSDGTDARAALREWSFGFGAEGVLDYASGWLAQAEPVGPYPLIDIDTAVARLNDGGYGYGGYYGGLIEPGIAIAEAPPVDAAVGAPAEPEIAVDLPESDIAEPEPEGSTDGSEGSTETVIDEEPMPVEPMPVEPIEEMPEPEPIVMTLVDVQADLWWAWDVDGSVWLLPAYRFIDAEGGWHVVPAVTDEFMIQTEPEVFIGEPMPAPEPLPVNPEPAPEPDVPEPIIEEPVTGEPDAVIVELNQLLPLPLDEFTERAAELGFDTRVVMQDGEGLAVTADFSETRINVAVEGDTVVNLQSVG
jgi:hypothetical protein